MPDVGRTADMFAKSPNASAERYETAWVRWNAELKRVGRLQRDSSSEVYASIWAAFAKWGVGNGIEIDALSADDFDVYLASRGGAEDLSDRHAWRLLRLADRVLRHEARVNATPPNLSAEIALLRRPELRYANAADKDSLPASLSVAEAKQLVMYLSAVRPGRATTLQSWQEVRNRASVGLMLGSGTTPGETRALELQDVVSNGGRKGSVPWKLQVNGDGNKPARQTPIAPWAGQLLKYWLGIRNEHEIPGQMLFPSTRATGKPWGKVSHYEATKNVLRAAGIDDIEGGSFRLRHTFALRQLRKATAPAEVARWLGVTDPAVMARYERVLTSPVEVV